jgi:hypothetical protein
MRYKWALRDYLREHVDRQLLPENDEADINR